MPDLLRVALAALLACALLAAVPSAAGAQRAFTTGFIDFNYFDPDAGTRDLWYDRTVSAGAGTVRLSPEWSNVAPENRPTGFRPSRPDDPNYRWGPSDAAVRDAAAHGLDVLIAINSAPAWAEAPGRPARERPGTWKPKPRELSAFATAMARRYSGTFPDPENPGRTLPRVRYWQIWNEGNLSTYLTPQWRRSGRRRVPASPGHYRKMLNASYDALKRVHSDNFVLSAGTAPYGDLETGGRRIPPARWMRSLLCVNRRLRPLRCSSPAKLDAIAHHPYSVGGPRRRANNRDDVSVPDLRKLTRPLRAAQRHRRVRPAGRKRVWITEISWDSRPPDPAGIPLARHARWLSDSFYLLWRQGVDTAIWFQVRDQAEGDGYASTYQSGIYTFGGRAKPAAAAFRFPFVADRRTRGRVTYWGKAPLAGPVEIQRRSGSTWQRIATTTPSGPTRVFTGTVSLRGTPQLRAVVAGEASPLWRVAARP